MARRFAFPREPADRMLLVVSIALLVANLVTAAMTIALLIG